MDNVQKMLKTSKKEYDDKRRVAIMDPSATESGYYTTLEHNFNQER